MATTANANLGSINISSPDAAVTKTASANNGKFDLSGLKISSSKAAGFNNARFELSGLSSGVNKVSTRYPLTFPADSLIRNADMELIDTTPRKIDRMSSVSQAKDFNERKWKARIELYKMNDSLAAEWRAFLAKLRGVRGTFKLGDPMREQPRGSASLSAGATVKSQRNKNDILTQGWATDVDNLFYPGDYFQHGNSMYQIVESVSSDSNGEARLHFEPHLRLSAASGDSIIIDKPQGIFRLSTNDILWTDSGTLTKPTALTAEEVRQD